MNLYHGRSETEHGIIIEELYWADHNFIYQPLPGTEGMDTLTAVEIRPEASGSDPQAFLCVRYLDSEGQTRVYCLDHPGSEYPHFYPTSDEPGRNLSEDDREILSEIMAIGFYYERYYREGFVAQHSDEWESQCQRMILHVLYRIHNDSLPPYLHGSCDEETECAIATLTEPDGFFQSTAGCPNFVPDRMFEDRTEPVLMPEQVLLWPTDYDAYGILENAVKVSDNEYLLFKNVSVSEGWCPPGVICRVTPTDGYPGWRVIETNYYKPNRLQYAPTVGFAPAS